ncbi:MAG: hypothetical protein HN742_39405 [Lentisphaerae bacterium]|jgi:hypothetical protein|nr:hypothetical protein [Lentisphaerota bacterium]MBT4822508.1 hypothetical protein [Lentisphaerota bacterium]MBT5605978.1 hypothetical protein [Lentisphaerota bacterium]MBT7060548.1 hypothetical protein [Lentisphaerota bacterium]MBT7848001.1 hypothetical protein [Lentisphaerota bacterium]
MVFDHIGLKTETRQPDETWVESSRVWVTKPEEHPFRVEWLRYAPDSPITGPVREQPHIAFRVDDIAAASQGLDVLLEPFAVGAGVRVGFYLNTDGVVVEFMDELASPPADGE